MKKKWPRKTMSCLEFKIAIIPFSDQDDVGYIRFESAFSGDYLGAIDSRFRIDHLKALHSAIGQIIKQKAKT